MRDFERLSDCDLFICSSYYGTNYSGLEDLETFEDYSDMETWVWDKLQHGNFVEVEGNTSDGDSLAVRFSPELVEYGDETYGIEDYLDESKSNSNGKKKINESVGDIDKLLGITLNFIADFSGLGAMEEDWLLYVPEGKFEPDEYDNPEDYPDLNHPVGDGYYVTQWFSDSIKEQLENKDADLLDQIVDYIDFYDEDGETYDNNINAVVKYLSEGLNKKGSKKISEDFGTDVSNIEGMVDAVLDFLYEYDYNALCDDGAFDSETMNFDPDFVESVYNSIENKDDELADNLDEIIDTLSAGERYDGKIDDIIDYIRGSYNGGERFRAMAIKKSTNESLEFNEDIKIDGFEFSEYENHRTGEMEVETYYNGDWVCSCDYDGWNGLRIVDENPHYSGIINKKDIEQFGVDNFYDYCLGLKNKFEERSRNVPDPMDESINEDTTNTTGMKRVNTTDFDKMCLKEVFPKVKELVKGIQKDLGSGNYETDDINGIVSAVASRVFECVTDELAKYFNGNKTNESLDEAYKGINLNDYGNIIYAALEALQDANISLGSMTDKEVATILRKLRHDEYAQRINKDVDDWSDEDFESEYEYEVEKREKEIDDLYDEYGRLRNESVQNESKKKETPKEAKCDEDEECDIDSPDDEM